MLSCGMVGLFTRVGCRPPGAGKLTPMDGARHGWEAESPDYDRDPRGSPFERSLPNAHVTEVHMREKLPGHFQRFKKAHPDIYAAFRGAGAPAARDGDAL